MTLNKAIIVAVVVLVAYFGYKYLDSCAQVFPFPYNCAVED
jgi:hypothetical protein